MTVTEPKLDEPGIGSPDDCAHYVRKGQIAEAAVMGGKVQALCGVWFQPIRDPEKYPVCQECKALLEQFGNRSNS